MIAMMTTAYYHQHSQQQQQQLLLLLLLSATTTPIPLPPPPPPYAYSYPLTPANGAATQAYGGQVLIILVGVGAVVHGKLLPIGDLTISAHTNGQLAILTHHLKRQGRRRRRRRGRRRGCLVLPIKMLKQSGR